MPLSVGDPVVILIPVLRRPHRVAPLMASVASATPEPHRVLFVVDDTDHRERMALESAGADHLIVPMALRSWPRKINAAFMATTEPVLFAGADDIEFRPGWLPAAMRRLTGPVEVVGTNDLLNPRVIAGEHATHWLFTRSYVDRLGTIDEPGKVLHEGYRHDYADDEFIATAKARGAFAHAPDSIVEHLHPWANKAPDDPVYRMARQHRGDGRRLFAARSHLWAA